MEIDVCLIKRGTMGGSDFMREAFEDKDACSMVCSDLKEEFVSYTPVPKKGEVISGDRVIVEGRVYTLIKDNSEDMLYERAVKKLTKQEMEAVVKHILKKSV